MNLFYHYTITLMLPFLLSLYFIKKSYKKATHYIYYILFFLSIPLTTFFSSWIFQKYDNHLSIGLNIYPFFVIIALLINILTGIQLSAYKAYVLSFFNVLIIDVLCAWQPSMVKNNNIFNYFDPYKSNYSTSTYYMTEIYLTLSQRVQAIGGNGVIDALFIYPTIAFLLFYLLEASME